MNYVIVDYCPATLREGEESYGRTGRKKLFDGKLVHHVLPYTSPNLNSDFEDVYLENKTSISISGVQEKFSVILEKNVLRLTKPGEHGRYLLKPIPRFGKNADQMPANEHLTMQIAAQVFGMETAENALIFFETGEPAYITKRFDVLKDGSKRAQEDFAALCERTPYTHGDNYKYEGSYLDMFTVLKKYVPAYAVEAPKLFKLIAFNFLFSNGDAHLKNFSLVETVLGDFKLSPAYDLLNSRMHINDSDFAMSEGLLPKNKKRGRVEENKMMSDLVSSSDMVKELIDHSFLNEKAKRSYRQAYETRLKKLLRD